MVDNGLRGKVSYDWNAAHLKGFESSVNQRNDGVDGVTCKHPHYLARSSQISSLISRWHSLWSLKALRSRHGWRSASSSGRCIFPQDLGLNDKPSYSCILPFLDAKFIPGQATEANSCQTTVSRVLSAARRVTSLHQSRLSQDSFRALIEQLLRAFKGLGNPSMRQTWTQHQSLICDIKLLQCTGQYHPDCSLASLVVESRHRAPHHAFVRSSLTGGPHTHSGVRL